MRSGAGQSRLTERAGGRLRHDPRGLPRVFAVRRVVFAVFRAVFAVFRAVFARDPGGLRTADLAERAEGAPAF